MDSSITGRRHLQGGEQRREVARFGDHRPDGARKPDAHLAREIPASVVCRDPAGREADMVQGSLRLFRCVTNTRRFSRAACWPMNSSRLFGAKRQIGVFGSPLGRRDAGRVGCHQQLIRRCMAHDKRETGGAAWKLIAGQCWPAQRRPHWRPVNRTGSFESPNWYGDDHCRCIGGVGDPYRPRNSCDSVSEPGRKWSQPGVTMLRDTVFPVGNVVDPWGDYLKDIGPSRTSSTPTRTGCFLARSAGIS